jgi:hypothetical protein
MSVPPSTKRWAYSDMPSFFSHSGVSCTAAHPLRRTSRFCGEDTRTNGSRPFQLTTFCDRQWPRWMSLSAAIPRQPRRAAAHVPGPVAGTRMACAPPDCARPCARADRADLGSPPRHKRASGPLRPPMRQGRRSREGGPFASKSRQRSLKSNTGRKGATPAGLKPLNAGRARWFDSPRSGRPRFSTPAAPE